MEVLILLTGINAFLLLAIYFRLGSARRPKQPDLPSLPATEACAASTPAKKMGRDRLGRARGVVRFHFRGLQHGSLLALRLSDLQSYPPLRS